ncbi:fimbrial protein [Providencia sp. Me31A]|uniref:fimbrial protein n=1 Tax=Providencia sp. Me31A TaxID=3392637 RepID=UPI003D2B05C0
MSLFRKITFAFGLPIMMSIATTNSAMAAANNFTEFRAKIVGGSCDISAPPTVSVNKGATIQSDLIIAGNSPVEPLELTISGCKGYGLTPVITLEGNVDRATGKPLFLAPSSSTKGYGILLTFDGNDNFKASTNLAEDMKLTAADKPWSTTMASELNGKVTLNTAVSCGNCAAIADIQGGELKANVTFKFAYN